MDLNNSMQTEEDLRCMKIGSYRAHQQAITVLDSEGGRVLTGSQDHTLKVYRYVQSIFNAFLFLTIVRLFIFLISSRLEDQLPLYTLHGHSGPISCLFIDRISPMTSGSGSQDGLLCVWDLLTGNSTILNYQIYLVIRFNYYNSNLMLLIFLQEHACTVFKPTMVLLPLSHAQYPM